MTTDPTPMSEDELKAIERRNMTMFINQPPAPNRDVQLLTAEVRRLNAEKKAAWRAAGDEYVWRMAVENDRDAKAKELTAVRAAVEEESKRANKAEAAARELRAVASEARHYIGIDVTSTRLKERINALLYSTAWLSTGGNDGK